MQREATRLTLWYSMRSMNIIDDEVVSIHALIVREPVKA